VATEDELRAARETNRFWNRYRSTARRQRQEEGEDTWNGRAYRGNFWERVYGASMLAPGIRIGRRRREDEEDEDENEEDVVNPAPESKMPFKKRKY